MDYVGGKHNIRDLIIGFHKEVSRWTGAAQGQCVGDTEDRSVWIRLIDGFQTI